ncbi:hypothetical protein C5B91_08420 [Haloferax sp. Atlit-10N]|uniref:hypothetical protein n=1 Tax=unclassified Haloferax TaxID=2625095 RepID=UPI000E227D6E|nr:MULTISPECIES: hypothetical protein [unclassified Haloferax]RDZ44981.1 hypothetical protein C5B87_12550 [Haloferax sp. Atlit-16N]RDZ59242.1 hypothetical protein C5B91_08420 [Haloferax sp. Atlit-10N]
MAINRRNILIGLGALVGGGGALVGTGAFTTVSAAREVSVSTAGDGSAFLQLGSSSPYVDDDTDGTLRLTLDADGQGSGEDAGFNENAVTTLTDVFTITNNSAEANNSVQVGLGSSSTAVPETSDLKGSVTLTVGSSDSSEDVDVTFSVGSLDSPNTPTLDPGESVTVDVKVDTTVSSTGANDSVDLSIFAVSTDSTTTTTSS